MVAITFSFRILQVDGRLLLQMSRVTGTSKVTVVVVAPLPFDSKAYDVPSGRQDSLRSRRDESGGVCHSVFLWLFGIWGWCKDTGAVCCASEGLGDVVNRVCDVGVYKAQ
jgi:hypothetical protein